MYGNENRINKWFKNRRLHQIQKTYCQIKEDHFYFPHNYYFRFGFMKGKKKLPFSSIEEIRINSWPPTAKVNNNELIFLFGVDKSTIQTLATSKNLTLSQPQDNWYLLLEEFLDAEYEDEHKRQTLHKLKTSGIPQPETIKIRRRFKFRMLITTFYSMEWIYYGQFDLLQQIWPLTQNKYWWTMDLALREKTS